MPATLSPPINGAARKSQVSREVVGKSEPVSPNGNFHSPTPDLPVSAAIPSDVTEPLAPSVADSNKDGLLDSPLELGKLTIVLGLGLSYREAEAWVKFDNTTIGRAVRRSTALAEEVRVHSQLARLYPLLRIHVASRRSWRAAAWLCSYLKKREGEVSQAELLAALVGRFDYLRMTLFAEEVLICDSIPSLPIGEASGFDRKDRAVLSGESELRPPPPMASLLFGAMLPVGPGRPSQLTPYEHGKLLVTLACGLTQREAATWLQCSQSNIAYLIGGKTEFQSELIRHTELARMHPYLRLFQSCSSSWKAAAELLVHLEQRHGKFTSKDLLAALNLLTEKAGVPPVSTTAATKASSSEPAAKQIAVVRKPLI